MPNENENFRSLEKRLALIHLKRTLTDCEDTPAVREIKSAVELLLAMENITHDLVNTHLRIKMLALESSITDQMTYVIMFMQLILLADYWPLNNDCVEDGTKYYICPLTLEKITGDRVFLKSGYQLDKEIFFDFFITAFNNHILATSEFRDPVTRAPITSSEMKYMLGRYPDLGPAILASEEYVETKKIASNEFANHHARRTIFIYALVTMLTSILLKAFIPAAIMTIMGPVSVVAFVVLIPVVFIAAKKLAQAKWKKLADESDAALIAPGNAIINNFLERLQEKIHQEATNVFSSVNNMPAQVSNPPVNTTAAIHQQLNIVIQPGDEKEVSSILRVPEAPSQQVDIASVTEVEREESHLAYYIP